MQPLDFSLKNVEVNCLHNTILQAKVMAVAFSWYFKAVKLVTTLVTLPRSVSAYLGSWLAVSVRLEKKNAIYLFHILFITLVS